MAKQTFQLNRTDLDYLLQQVEIGIDYTQLNSALDPRGVRETAGTNNNIVGHGDLDNDPLTNDPGPNSGWGASDEAFLRLSQTSDRTGVDETGATTDYAPYGGTVTDTNPRIISNLVSNQNVNANPAVQPAVDAWGGEVDGNGLAFIPNVGPLGGSSYNSWFVFFGQFFDHGLDFIQKDGSSGFVLIPILPGDPLYIDPSDPEFVAGRSNVMMISRANLANDDTDFTNGVLNAGVTPVYNNNTGLLVDQSQTYGSDPTVNAFMREYDGNGATTGRVATGNTAVLDDAIVGNEGQAVGLATWADIKQNALRIGVILSDTDVLNAPMLKVDAKGQLTYTVGINAPVDTSADLAAVNDPNDPFVRDIATGEVLRTNQAFLLDINPAAHPEFGGIARTADTDTVSNFPADPDFDPAGGFTYDNELLDAHRIVGDGRANENFALTSVHHVWHEEHNFQVNNIQQSLLDEAANILATDGQAAADAFLADWETSPGVWDGEKLFQAARIITETEYNHVAIDEYVGRLVADLPEFVSYSTDINPAVSLEFSQAIFRLGHSMLTENLDVIDQQSGAVTQVPLLQAFLNPEGFEQFGAAAIAEGAIKQLANEVDEFVTPALQQTLLGQPLDLAAINIARGRDIGLPTWNEFREQVFNEVIQNTNNTNGGGLKPYESWAEIGAHLRNPDTLVNLVAAYAEDAQIKSARDANDLVLARDLASQRMLDQAFMEGTPVFQNGEWTISGGDQGFWDIDLWVGGLAERPLIDGMLGTTFSFVFLDFAQRMQDGDRFYYLYRLPPGTNIGDEIISTKFSDIIARNTGLDNLNGDSFAYADTYFIAGDPDPNNNFVSQVDGAATHYYFNADTAVLDDGVTRASDGHIVIAGGDGNDWIKAGNGDDTIHGGPGDDFINGNQGNDTIFGGAGNDFIIDDENDDFIRGDEGDDIIYAGKGVLDTVFGGEGNDELHGGDGIDELFGGVGDDALFGDGDTDVIFGEDGNDYMEGGDSVDEMWGGNGNDIMLGGVGDDHLNGDGGNDLLFGGLGAAANDGDRLLGDAIINRNGAFPAQEGGFDDPPLGFDIGSYEFVGIDITADLQTSNQNGTGSNLIDTYAFLDGLVGSRFDDNLTGAGVDTITTNGVDNMLVGGSGNDELTGLGGNDIIVGDWAVVSNDLSIFDGNGAPLAQDKTNAEIDSHGLNRIDVGDLLPAGHLREAHLGHVLGDNGAEGTDDVAVFRGNFADYTFDDLGDGWLGVRDNRDPELDIDGVATNTEHDGDDVVRGVEILRFADGDRQVRQILNNAPIVSGPVLLPNLLVNTAAVFALTDLLANASDLDFDPLTVQNLTVSSGNFIVDTMGTPNIQGDDTITFTPVTGDTTEVTFSYEVSDGIEATPATAVIDLVPVPGQVISGTNGDDVLSGTEGNDQIVGLGGSDTIFGFGGNDFINGGAQADTILGGAGNDTILGGGGADRIWGEDGNDMIFGDGGRDQIWGGDGDDIIEGGASRDIIRGGDGNDTLQGGTGRDTVNGNAGDDTFLATTGDGNRDRYNGGTGQDTLDLTDIGADATVDMVLGRLESADTGTGANADQFLNIENIVSGAGNDTIIAGTVSNVLSGGFGSDAFVFSTIAAADGDRITDFQTGDVIDLTAIDADTADGGNQTFELKGEQGAFSATGEIIVRHVTDINGADQTVVEGNVNQNLTADFSITLDGNHSLTTSDFLGVA